jgi:hypothetical protein
MFQFSISWIDRFQSFGYSNLISTSMSVDMATTFAVGAGGTVAQADVKTVGAVLCFDTARGDRFGRASERAYADLRWISKFPDEQEWLMIPLNSFSLPTVETERASGRDRHGFVNRTAVDVGGPPGGASEGGLFQLYMAVLG